MTPLVIVGSSFCGPGRPAGGRLYSADRTAAMRVVVKTSRTPVCDPRVIRTVDGEWLMSDGPERHRGDLETAPGRR